MLQHTPGMPVDRKIKEKNARDLSFRSDQELGVSLEPPAERPLLRVLRTYAPSVFLTLVACLLPVPLAGAESDHGAIPTPSLFIEVQLDAPLKLSHLEPGNALQGKVAHDVYSGNRLLFPAGSRVHLTVGNLEHRGREHNDHWPWVVQFFIPRHENHPSFQSASISLPDGTRIPMRVSFVSAIHRVKVSARAKPATHAKRRAKRQPRSHLEKRRPGNGCQAPAPNGFLRPSVRQAEDRPREPLMKTVPIRCLHLCPRRWRLGPKRQQFFSVA
jgi:hypothetical protein